MSHDPEQLVVAPTAGVSDLASDELDQEIGDAARALQSHLEQAGMAALRLGRALIPAREDALHLRYGYATFDAYCQERHGISSKLAHLVTMPLYRLTDEGYRALLQQYSLRKAYALSVIGSIAPDALAALTTPDADGVAPAAQLTQRDLDERVRATQDAHAQVVRLEQELAIQEQKHTQIVARLRANQVLLQSQADTFYTEREAARADVRGGEQRVEAEAQAAAARVAALRGELRTLQEQVRTTATAPVSSRAVAPRDTPTGQHAALAVCSAVLDAAAAAPLDAAALPALVELLTKLTAAVATLPPDVAATDLQPLADAVAALRTAVRAQLA